jgi:hypothetical protein
MMEAAAPPMSTVRRETRIIVSSIDPGAVCATTWPRRPSEEIYVDFGQVGSELAAVYSLSPPQEAGRGDDRICGATLHQLHRNPL